MKKSTYIIILVLLCTVSGFAQSGSLVSDTAFFRKELPAFEYWMTKTGVDKHFAIKNLKVEKDTLRLFLTTNYNSSDSMVVVWNALRKSYDSLNINRLPAELIDYFAFQMEVKKEQVVVYLVSENGKHIFLSLEQHEDSLVSNIDMLKKAKMRSFGTISIMVDELKSDRTFSTLSTQSLYRIRRQISKYMSSYFKNKGTRFWHKAEYDVMKDNYNELTFEVSNLTYEILNDVGYFEFIQITIKVEKKGDEILINYLIKGKYGSGIFSAPRRGDYKNMEPKYTDYIERYQNKLEQNIRKILTK